MVNFPTTIPELAGILDVPIQELSYLADTIERNTSVKKIPKPSGGKRTITAPSRKLKALLSHLDSVLLCKIPLHPLLYHRPGSSYIEMIKQHLNSRCLITADIDDFYPTVSPKKVFNALVSEGLENAVARAITRLTTAFHSLPQGFPTSPTLAGIVLKPVGIRLAGLAAASHLRVGLYADNLAVSADYDVSKFERLIIKIFRQNGFKLDKWKVMTRGDRQEIMNIVVDSGLRVKSEYQDEVRTDIYMLSKMKFNDSSDDYRKKLKSVQGKLSHIRSINTHQAEVLSAYARKLAIKL